MASGRVVRGAASYEVPDTSRPFVAQRRLVAMCGMQHSQIIEQGMAPGRVAQRAASYEVRDTCRPVLAQQQLVGMSSLDRSQVNDQIAATSRVVGSAVMDEAIHAPCPVLAQPDLVGMRCMQRCQIIEQRAADHPDHRQRGDRRISAHLPPIGGATASPRDEWCKAQPNHRSVRDNQSGRPPHIDR